MGNAGRRGRRAAVEHRTKLSLYERARELIEYLVENDGHVACTKQDLAVLLSQRFNTLQWLTLDGRGDRRLVETVCNLTRDQADDPVTQSICAGYVAAYAPNAGGLTLVDESGEMPPHMALHMLQGDLNRQLAAKTTWRRRLPYWKAAAKQAALSSDADLARILWRIHDKIEETGFSTDDLVREYADALVSRGFGSSDE